ncbi:DNA-binding protein [Paraburkholderia acidiphila]|uniref:Transcriptional regulator n=1 Tax=Paraburkholderia acidiphila TaxID=2571747 RepID=A0A7Z2G7A7_9BURK|nr:DNA-binding protein [Paraburkholderia acidiphila]QGZ56372.1 transcriptional regulator [Paraburkholderia acidiphila]
MPRPAAVTSDAIRATVLTMLAEAGDPAPASDARFRKIISVRKLRARLGAGDPAMLSRHLNAIEAELVQAGVTGFAVPDLPPEIAQQMRTLWEAAVATQLDGVVRLRREAEATAHASEEAQHNAQLRVELLREELAEVRGQLTARDTALAVAHTEAAAAAKHVATLEGAVAELRSELAAAEMAARDGTQAHAADLATERARYDGLSRQLLRETAHQRETFQTERQRLEGELARAAERLQALESLRERLLTELAAERSARQQTAAEATALATVIGQQRQTLLRVRTGAVNRKPAALRPALATHMPKTGASRRKAR